MHKTSNYEHLYNTVLAIKCDGCQGSGEVDDAEPGDIGYNIYQCSKCKGSGISPDADMKLFVSSMEIKA